MEGPYKKMAWHLKQKLIQIHPDDPRLKKGDVKKWAIHLKAAEKELGITQDRLVDLLRFIFKDESKQAQYWRKHGIRSASGIRKNAQEIYDQMTMIKINQILKAEVATKGKQR